jgi:PLP dependent protein
MPGSISSNIDTIRRDLPATVKLMAVTKQVSVIAMREAYATGIRDFGESRIQEAEAKQQELADLPDLDWHLIGHLQSNKIRKALQPQTCTTDRQGCRRTQSSTEYMSPSQTFARS